MPNGVSWRPSSITERVLKNESNFIELKNSHKIKNIDMVYKKEAKYGEKLISQVELKNENTTIHRLKNMENEDLFLAECNWC